MYTISLSLSPPLFLRRLREVSPRAGLLLLALGVLRQFFCQVTLKANLMGEANRNGVGPNNTLCSLQRFKLQSCEFSDSERLDLNLGLSLGGCYGQIPKDKPLVRASSLNGDLGLNEDDEGNGFISLVRTSSLPAEGEQDLRKLKEKQAMKRMVAKRRMEKHRQSSRGGGVCEEERSLWEPKLPNWATESAATKNAGMPRTAFSGAFQKFKSNVNSSANLKIEGPENPTAAEVYKKFRPTVSSRAVEHGKSIHPSNCCFKPVVDLGTMASGKSAYSARLRSATAAITLDKMANGKPSEATETEQEKPPKKVRLLANGVVDISTMEMMRLMPSVTTTGDGPNGMKIEGFLYRYLKGQVSIVCVCHGSFFSPAEFVKHAGGSGVGNPMKRINVLPVTL